MRNYQRFDNPPNIITAIGILFGLLILEILISAAYYDTGYGFENGDPASSIIAVFANGIVFSVIMHYTKLSYSNLFHLSENRISTTLILLSLPIFITVLGTFWWLNDVSNLVASLFPQDKVSLKMLMRMMDGGIITVISICIIAPFLEEMLFRGIILRGFLSHYSPQKAIIASSALFSLMHLNIYQIPTAFVLGCFIGWIYYKSRSLWPCILAHAINNAGAYLFFMNASELDEKNSLFDLMTIFISIAGIFILHKIFDFGRSSQRQSL